MIAVLLCSKVILVWQVWNLDGVGTGQAAARNGLFSIQSKVGLKQQQKTLIINDQLRVLLSYFKMIRLTFPAAGLKMILETENKTKHIQF